MEQLSRSPTSKGFLQLYPAQQRGHGIRPEWGVPAPHSWLSPVEREEEMLLAFLCLTSLLCKPGYGQKRGCKTHKNPWKESKGLG